MKRLLLIALVAMGAGAQTLQLPPGTLAPILNTIRSGSGAPSNSLGNNGDFYIDTTGHMFYGPKAIGVWPTPGTSMIGPSGGGGGSWGTITGTLCNQTDLCSALNAKQATGNYITSLSGDGTASGPGAASFTLASVNSGSGTCGDATHVCQVTTDAKGRVLTQAQVAITTSGTGTVTHTLGALTAGQLVIGNGSGDLQVGNLSGDVTTSGGTAATLATVNSSPGTFGTSSQIPVLTVDGKGRITGITTVAASGGGGGSGFTAGALSSIPSTCVTGGIYFATDQPAGQQLYTCSATNVWTQMVSLGGSGALAYSGGSLDIVTSVVPRLAAANHFTGSNQFDGTTTLGNVTITGTCSGCSSSGQTELVDSNDNPTLKSGTAAASAVNYINATDAATGGTVGLLAAGSDTDISLEVGGKGGGLLLLNSDSATADPSGNIVTNGNLTTAETATAMHFISSSGSPTFTPGSALGSGGTVSGSGSDHFGIIFLTTGSSPSAGQGITITYAHAYPTAAFCVHAPASSGVSVGSPWRIGILDPGYFTLYADSTPAASTTYSFTYACGL